MKKEKSSKKKQKWTAKLIQIVLQIDKNIWNHSTEMAIISQK